MSVSLRLGASLALALVLLCAIASCSRRQAHREAAARAPSASVYENPAAEPHPSPPQPAGPQTAGRDSLLKRYRPRLAEWTGLWAAAQPGFVLDSTWLVARRRWSPLRTHEFDPPEKESPEDVTFEILGILSPDARYTLNVDGYQFIELAGDTLEVGGDPESACSLIDNRTRREAVLQMTGTMGAFDWGTWLAVDVFAIGGYVDADAYGQWKQARLWIYAIADSSVSEYQSRIVSEADYERYVRAWYQWLLGRYRAAKRSRAAGPASSFTPATGLAPLFWG